MIRGGYGEHGRSCFLVEYNKEGRMYMVDCGIMDTDPFPYPDVTPEELERVDYLFLTHCHKDHSGAFQYFCERGFHGTLVTSGMTCKLAGIGYEKVETLEVGQIADDAAVGPVAGSVVPETAARSNIRQFGPLTVRFGRTGHCPGGLWFAVADGGDAIVGASVDDAGTPDELLFTGDYQEDTLVYACDPIRDSHAKLALIDCAHRGTELDAGALRAQLVRVVAERLQNRQRVLLPVPQYGRGLEILYLMRKEFPQMRIRVDRDFVGYAEKMLSEPVWYKADAYDALTTEKFDVMDVEAEGDYDILLLADTHLKKQKNVEFVNRAIEEGAAVLINGRVKKNGPVGKLLDAGKAERFLFPHHQSHGDLKHVIANNSFHVILPFHNEKKEVLV